MTAAPATPARSASPLAARPSVNGIPTGTTCTVTEVAPDAITGFTWGPITYTPASVVIGTNPTVSITVGNSITRDRGSLRILKTLSNPDGATVPASFLVDYSCGTGQTGQVSVSPGNPATVTGIPTGSTCTVTEVAPAAIPGFTWGTITYTPASVVIGPKDSTVEITVGNSITRDRGSLRILKVFDAPGGVVVPASFAVRYDCGASYKGWVSVAPDSPVTINGIPTGSTCEVRELKPKDIPDFTWGPVTYSPESVVIGKDTPVEISVTNTLTGGGGEGAGGGPSKGGGGGGQPPTDTLVPTDSVSAASGPVDGISWILLILLSATVILSTGWVIRRVRTSEILASIHRDTPDGRAPTRDPAVGLCPASLVEGRGLAGSGKYYGSSGPSGPVRRPRWLGYRLAPLLTVRGCLVRSAPSLSSIHQRR